MHHLQRPYVHLLCYTSQPDQALYGKKHAMYQYVHRLMKTAAISAASCMGLNAQVGINAFLYMVAMCNCVQPGPVNRGILLLLQVLGNCTQRCDHIILASEQFCACCLMGYLGAQYWQLLVTLDISGGAVPSVVPLQLQTWFTQA